jgi:hypothetical protein
VNGRDAVRDWLVALSVFLTIALLASLDQLSHCAG